MTNLIFDDAELLRTAKVVCTINPGGYKPESLVDQMKRMASKSFADGGHGYLTTGGWVLTLWTDENGARHIYSSVMTYSVEHYLAVGECL